MQQAGLSHRDALVKAFIKIEAGCRFTDPRNISPRRPAFLATIGPYIHAVEQAAKKAPFLVKGLDPLTKLDKMGSLRSYPAFIETDYSRFDRTISQDILLNIECALLRAIYPPSEHPDLDVALSLLLRTKGLHSLGVWYTTDGGRCSGDAQTSLCNGLINHFLTWVVFSSLPSNSWTSFHEGDDGIIGITKDCLNSGLILLEFISAFGFKLKITQSFVLEDVTFCGRFLTFSDRLHDCADLFRALAKFHVTSNKGNLKELALAKAMSYYHTDHDTPILSWWCYCIVRHLLPQMRQHWVRHVVKQMRSRDRDRFITALDGRRYERPPGHVPALYALIVHRVGLSFGAIDLLEDLCKRAIREDIIPVLPRLPVFDEIPVEDSQNTLFSEGVLIV